MSDTSKEHYLKEELYDLVRKDDRIFEFLQSGSLDGIWYWDLESPDHEWMSEEFWRTLGYEPNEHPHLASAWQDIINAEDLAVALENFEKHCADERHPYDQVVRYRHANNSTVYIRCRGIAIRNEQGTPVRMLGAHTDITPYKELEAKEEQLADQLELVEKSNQSLEEFAYIASHDLNAPLRRITSFLGLISEKLNDNGDEELKGWMNSVNSNASYMQKMIDDLLELSRANASDYEIEELELDQIVEQALKNLSEQRSKWKGDMQIGELPRIAGIQTLMIRLFQNLLQNAMTYSKEDQARVEVFATLKEGIVEVSICDNGIGVDSKHHQRIFDIFKRLHGRQQYDGGTGMGLAICKRIVERHDGEISIQSRLGEGTTIVVRLKQK